MYGMVAEGLSTIDFYKDGEFFDVSDEQNGDPPTNGLGFGGSRDFVFLSRGRSGSATAEGVNGRGIAVALWARSLGADELRSWYEDPFQVLQDRRFALADVPDDVRFGMFEVEQTEQPAYYQYRHIKR